MQKNTRLRLFSYLVIAYMLLALGWWTFLLFTKNRDAFVANKKLYQMMMIANQGIESEANFLQSEVYQDLMAKYTRQKWMILGEAFVFAIILVIGIWFINRGYNQQVTSAKLSRNFLLSITHELKSPLAAIRLILETLQKRELQPAKVQQLSQNALQETGRLTTLVNDLLLAAKVETTYQPNIESINISNLLENIVRSFRQRYSQATIDCKTVGIIEINADRNGLVSIITNLLENAIKYANNTPVIQIHLYKKNTDIQIEIADNGIGIADEEKSKIFDRFYRIGNEDTRKTKGTGLGLYIVNQIVKAHQGTIAIRNNQPTGSVFTVCLPVKNKRL